MRAYYLSALICIAPLTSVFGEMPSFGMEEPQNLIISNRILAKVNDKTISVMDVVKKMDVFLNRAYPHLVGSKTARYQFYTSSWRDVLEQMIDDELIIVDSEGKDLKISDGDVREKLQERFGPNVMGNLDKLNISYDEARKMIYTELVVQKMMWYRVNARALTSVNPQDVKASYKEYCAQHPPVEKWKYQVLSVRSKNSEMAEKIATRAYEALILDKLDFQTVAAELNAQPVPERETVMTVSDRPEEKASIMVSEEYEVTDKEISTAHRQALFGLKEGTYSKPVSQISRVDNSSVCRIFCLKEHSRSTVPVFETIEEKLENELVQRAINKEGAAYIAKLRERYGYDKKHMQETVPSDFQPFALK